MAIADPMLRRLRFLLLFLFCVLPATGYGADLDRFAGQWRATSVDTGGGLDVSADDLALKLEPADQGFELEWRSPGGGVERVRFAETKDHPGIYSAPLSKGGFLGFFSSSAERNPLEGDPLVWARFDGDAFVVYRLVINDGGAFTLDRYERTLRDDTLELQFTRRAHGQPVRSLTADLQRTGSVK